MYGEIIIKLKDNCQQKLIAHHQMRMKAVRVNLVNNKTQANKLEGKIEMGRLFLKLKI